MNFEHTEDRRMLSDMLRRFVAEQYDIATRHRNAGAERGHSPEFWRRYAELGAIGAVRRARRRFGRRRFRHRRGVRGAGRGLVSSPSWTRSWWAAIAQAGTPAQRESLDGLIAGERSRRWPAPSRMPATTVAPRPTPSATARAGGCTGPRRSTPAGTPTCTWCRRARPAPGRGRRHQPVPGRGQRAGPERPWLRAGRRRPRGRADAGPGARTASGAGQAGAGHALLEHATGRGLLALCAEALGAMDCARDATLEYLRTRRQFGAPIGSFQALQHRMADLLLEIEQARSAVINAAALDLPDRLAREQALSAQVHHGRIGTLVAEEASSCTAASA